ncbi:MAG: hypothetical protein IM600_08500 [Bacteroidetes bacterium]|nr:hypothetical protein [Bacteroidota bacterium]
MSNALHIKAELPYSDTHARWCDVYKQAIHYFYKIYTTDEKQNSNNRLPVIRTDNLWTN